MGAASVDPTRPTAAAQRGTDGERAVGAGATARKRVLYLTHSAALDGSSLCLLSLLQRLDRARFEPVVALPVEGALSSALRARGVEIRVEPSLRPLFWMEARPGPRDLSHFLRALPGVAAVRRLCRALEPDLVHINSSVIFHLAIGAAGSGSARVILHAREHWDLPARDPRDRLKRWVVERYVDRVIAVSREALRCFDAADKSVLRYEWPDPAHARDAADGPLPLPDAGALFLDLGGRHPHKGALDSLRAMQHVGSGAHLAVPGGTRRTGSPLAEGVRGILGHTALRTYGIELDRLAAAMPARVTLLPPLRNVVAAMERARAILCPFRTPHFSMPALEAGALSRPVIATDWPEAREVIIDGETGLLVPPGDVRALARAVQALLDDPARADAMGARAAEHVAQSFDAASSMAILHDLYGEP